MMPVGCTMSESAREGALVVGGSEAERSRWAAALADLVDPVAAADGAEALERVGPETEILLVHRDLPERTATELVAAVRERGITVRAALLTPETPETDVVERGFDAWLLTPVEEGLLQQTVEGLLACRRYDRAIADLYALASEQATEEAETMEVRERIEAARTNADAALEAVESIDREALLANSPAAFRDDHA